MEDSEKLLAALEAHRDALFALEIRARPPRQGGKGQTSGKWPKDPYATVGVIDPEALDDPTLNRPESQEICDTTLGVCDKHRAGNAGHFYRVTLLDEEGHVLHALVLTGLGGFAVDTVQSATVQMAHEFAAITQVIMASLTTSHRLLQDSYKTCGLLVKMHTDSPLANAQVELLKVQLEAKRGQWDHDEEVARFSELGDVLKMAMPYIMTHFGGPTPEAPQAGETVLEDWKKMITELPGDKLKAFDADLWSVAEAARDADSDDACRACLDTLKTNMQALPPDKQLLLVEALGADGFQKLGEFLTKWGLV